MRLALLSTLCLTLATASCQLVPPRVEPADVRAARAEKPRSEPTRAPARASATPAIGQPPGTSAPPQAGPVATLQRPAGETTVLAGTVAVDASYLVASGGGNILSHNGGQIVAAGGLNLVGADAASLVAAGGLNLIAAVGGNLVAAGGGNLVAAGGGNLVAAGAGNVVAPNGARYALAAEASASPATAPSASAPAAPSASAPAAPSASTPAAPSASSVAAPQLEPGTVLPAAGMRLSVHDLRTGAPVALGVDAQGQPVYAVYSSAAGAFELYVPKALASNLRVEARVPGADDPRLAYEVLAQPGGAPAAIDEDSALVYRYLAESWRGRMTSLMTELAAEPARSDDAVLKKLYGRRGTTSFTAMVGLLKPLLAELRASMKAAQLAEPAAIAAASARAADTVLARVDLSGLVASQAIEYKSYLSGEEKAFAVFIDAVKQVRGRAAEQMRTAGAGGHAGFLAATPFATAGARIAKAADVPAFIVAEAYTDEQEIQAGAALAYFLALGFERREALRLQGRLWAANTAAGEHLGVLLATDASVKADLLAALAAR